MIRTAVPGVSAKIVVWPAAISPTTGRCTGRSGGGVGDVAEGDGVPVHRRVVEDRQRHRREMSSRHGQSERLQQRVVERLHRLDPGQDALEVLLDGDGPVGRSRRGMGRP